MNPFTMFLLAILSPLLLATTLLAPIYAGVAGATYIIYHHTQSAKSIYAQLADVFYILNTYGNLFRFWSAHIAQTNFFTYSMPLIGLPVFGLLLAFWLTGALASKLKDIFQLGVAH